MSPARSCAVSSTSLRPGRGRRARRPRSLGPRSSRRAPGAAPSRGSPAASSSSSGSTYGGFETTRSNGPVEPSSRSPCTSSTCEAGALARSPRPARARPRDVDRGHPRARVLVGDRQRDRPRAGSDVEHPRRSSHAGEQRQAALDGVSVSGRGMSARAVDRQRQPAEAPLAERRTASGSRAARRATSSSKRVRVDPRRVARRVQLRPRDAERRARRGARRRCAGRARPPRPGAPPRRRRRPRGFKRARPTRAPAAAPRPRAPR